MRVYRRAQNGEVGSVTSARLPVSSGRGSPARAGFQAEPSAGPTSAVIPLMRTAARSVIARPNADAFAVSRSERRL